MRCLLLHEWSYSHHLVVDLPRVAAIVKRECLRCGKATEFEFSDAELEKLLEDAA